MKLIKEVSRFGGKVKIMLDSRQSDYYMKTKWLKKTNKRKVLY